jgi:predicted ferric reductase
MKMQMKMIAALVASVGLFSFASVHAEDNAAAKTRPAHKWTADTNNDGKVSYDEYRAANEKRSESQFKRMDTNGDGFIDQDEKKAMGDKMRAMREKRHSGNAKAETPAAN